MKALAFCPLIATLLVSAALHADDRPPIIDMHLHAQSPDGYGPPGVAFCMEFTRYVPPMDPADGPIVEQVMAFQMNPGCENPMIASADLDALLGETLAQMEEWNVRGVISGPPEIVSAWKAAAPERFIAGRQFNFGRERDVTPEVLADEYRKGQFEVFAEVTNQYINVAPDDPKMDAYWALADELGFPVGIHLGPLPPGSPLMVPGSIALGDPISMEPVLKKYPKLRVYIMHAGVPFIDRSIALMQTYPHVYAGTGVLQAMMTRAAYEDMLRRFVDAGLGKRLMYGTDQMAWPEMIGRSIERVLESEVLSDEQKRDILYNNAARFLRLE